MRTEAWGEVTTDWKVRVVGLVGERVSLSKGAPRTLWKIRCQEAEKSLFSDSEHLPVQGY